MTIKDNFFATPSLARYTLFTLLFQTGMAVSLAAMPVYFRNENAISAYGMAYSAMAITGAFSFVYGWFVDKIGFAKALIFGVLLYGLALSLRIITHPIVAVMVAIMAGVGASVAILANRSWVLELSETSSQNTTQLTAMRSMIINGAMLTGSGVVSLVAYVFGAVYFWLLLLAGGLIFVASFLAYQNYQSDKHKPVAPQTQKPSLKTTLTLPALLFIGANLLVGIYTGLFKPYLILMFVDYGISESKSVFIYLLTTAMSILAGFLLLKYNTIFKNIPFIGFFGSMLGLIGAFLLLIVGLKVEFGLWLLVLAVLVRSLCLSFSSAFEQILEYDLLNKATLGVVLGFTQTAFLAGDALGSLFTSLWIIPKNANDYVQICLYCAILVAGHLGIIAILRQIGKKID